MVVVSLNHSRRDRNATRAVRRQEEVPAFIGVDGEGVTGDDGVHRYVLLGVGDRQIENPAGLSFQEIMGHLYDEFQERPAGVYAGFFLSYDFSHWTKHLPEERAWSLYIDEGIRKRQRKTSGGNTVPFPVRWDGWEFDTLGMRRFKLRPACCEKPWECQHKAAPWMYVNDAGPFWQTSLLNAIDPKRWPDGPIVTDKEYEMLREGKQRRSIAILDNEMRFYNRLENGVFARLMTRQAEGLLRMGIRLSKDQWYGPGQASAEWLRQQKMTRRKTSTAKSGMLEAARKSYMGGWFELFAHGKVEGETYEYDINSAYPHIMSELPCLEHGTWAEGKGKAPQGMYVLVEGTARGSDRFVGAMLHRTPQSQICRPRNTRGIFWSHELTAAKRAGVVDSWSCTRWWQYSPCPCTSPLKNLASLYSFRQSIGKNTSAGKAAKLVYNSAYGKFAQSVGSAPYGNWIYASLITAGCRVMILDAISSHPDGRAAVVMVATDGVYFTSPHTGLPISEELGQWETKTKRDIFLFKPGFYWDADSKGRATYKSRGIRASDFASQIPKIERQFGKMTELARRNGGMFTPPVWPFSVFYSSFSMVTPSQALRQGHWERVAVPQVCTCGAETARHAEDCQARRLVQSSNPETKRQAQVYVDSEHGFLRSMPYDVAPGGVRSKPYDKRYADEQAGKVEDISPDGGMELEWMIATRELRGEE